MAIANIKSASLADLCQSVVTDTPLGKVGMLIIAGGDNPATATDLQIGMTDLKGDSSFSNIRIGVDASTVNTAAKGSAGDFAQDADAITEPTAWCLPILMQCSPDPTSSPTPTPGPIVPAPGPPIPLPGPAFPLPGVPDAPPPAGRTRMPQALPSRRCRTRKPPSSRCLPLSSAAPPS